MRRGSVVAVVLTLITMGATAHAQEQYPSTTNSTNSNNNNSNNNSNNNASSASSEDQASCDTNPSATRCQCRTTCCYRGDSCACHNPSLRLSVVGIRPTLTRISSAGTGLGTTNDFGVGFAGSIDSYALDGASHGQMQFMLGGGQAGFEGMLAGVIELGYRLDVSEKQGPFARAAFDGRMQGNDRLYFSALELPRLTLGWQFLSGRTVLELGARGGPILTGRFNPGDSGVRNISGSIEYGAFASAQVEFLKFEATAMRIDARKTGNFTPVDLGRGSVCAIAGKVGICGDFTIFRGDARFPIYGHQEALATYAGVTVGVASW